MNLKVKAAPWAAIGFLLVAGPVRANDWEKFFTPYPGTAEVAVPSAVPPEQIASQGFENDVANMWRRGFIALGYTYFNSPNAKTKDAERLAKKLKARYFVTLTDLTSSQTTSVPLTLPSTTTSTTNGNVFIAGSGGYANGTYNGTTTTYGTRTTYIPMTVNRFDKFAVYFAEMPKRGTGIYPRDLNADEIAKYETQRGFVVQFIRDGSPAYHANILPGDVVTEVNGVPADLSNWIAASKADSPMAVTLFRNGQRREIAIPVPPEWRPM